MTRKPQTEELVLTVLLTGLLAATGTAWGQEPEGPRPGDTRVVRAYFDDRLVAARAVMSLEALESEYEKGYIVLRATEEDIETARRAGMRIVEDDDHVSVALPSEPPTTAVQGTIAGFPCYRTVEETYASALAIARAHPQLASWRWAGRSWKKVQSRADGYVMHVLRLTNSETPGPKPALFITAALHAREYTTAELALRFAEHLANSYETDADVRWLLDYQEVHIMLQANPDGRKRAEAGLLWRKNHNANHCPESWPGVDLNRNFDFKWGEAGSSTNHCSIVYRGLSAASEPETQAIQTYMANLFPDARGPDDEDAAPTRTSGVVLDIHSHGRLILWPWGHVYEAAPNGTALQTLGRKLAYFNGYTPLQGIGLYPVSGATEDYGYGVLGRASFTYELGSTFFQGCSDFENSILDNNLESLLYAFKVARTPYLTPAGPDVRDLGLSGATSTTGVPAGTTITVSATLDDTRYENSNGTEATQNIAAAEYYLDVPHWATGAVANGISASDGAFESRSEAATATIDTTGLSTGRHTVFVRGKDTDGNWGAVSAVFLFVGKAPPSQPPAPTIEAKDGQLGVRWTAPADNGSAITGYAVRHRSTARSSSWSAADVGAAGRYTIAGLINAEQYEVQVRAINAVGGSRWSGSSAGTPEAADGPGGPEEGSCAVDENTLCLHDSRYRVQTMWRTADGRTGIASVAEHTTDDSGLFTFHNPENWEILIKVLDGCALNGHVWVYGASTTDQGYLIQVTDTATGAVREYRNEPGVPAPAITDAKAFPEGCRP